MIQPNYFECESCGALAKLLHALCPECLPKYEIAGHGARADPPQINKQGEPGERPGIRNLKEEIFNFRTGTWDK